MWSEYGRRPKPARPWCLVPRDGAIADFQGLGVGAIPIGAAAVVPEGGAPSGIDLLPQHAGWGMFRL